MLITHTNKYFTREIKWQNAKFSLLSVIVSIYLGFANQAISNDIVSLDKKIANFPTNLDTAQSPMMLPEYVVIEPSDEVTFSSETSASVATLSVKEGSLFRAGDILLELDCRVQDADLKKAVAQLAVADLAFVSAKKLKSYGSISDLEYQQAESQMNMANADVDKLKAIVEKCTLKAPFNGSVAKLLVHVHETVKPGDPLLKIVSTDNLDFVMQIPSNWLEWLHIDTEFDVHINELNKVVRAKVTKINPEIDSVSQTVKIIGKEIDTDIPSNLRPGMSGQASFPDNINSKHSQMKK